MHNSLELEEPIGISKDSTILIPSKSIRINTIAFKIGLFGDTDECLEEYNGQYCID